MDISTQPLTDISRVLRFSGGDADATALFLSVVARGSGIIFAGERERERKRD